MFNQNGLSLDQAPPIWVVFRFFLVGSLFGVLGGIGMIMYGEQIFDASDAPALIITHIFTLGVMLSFMLGALFQMLPVIAGVVLSHPTKHGNMVQIPLVIGIFSLLFGFFNGSNLAFIFASVFLGYSLLYVIALMTSRLIRLKNQSASSRGIMYALFSLFVVVLLGLYMNSFRAGLLDGFMFVQAKEIHYSFGLLGWISLLIVSISFQVVEMFYVTPPYPKIISRWMPFWIVATLVLLAFSIIFFEPLTVWLDAILFMSLGAFGALTLLRLSQRKRPIVDASIWFWRIGMGSMITSMALLLFDLVAPSEFVIKLAIVFYATFATSVIFAMFYKIVPFLTWFHLNSEGYLMAPMMHEIIHPKSARKQLYVFVIAVISLLIGTEIGVFMYLASVFIIVFFGQAVYQVIQAGILYRHTKETTEKFDFSTSD